MLNKRQINILKDLQEAKEYITASKLAMKYGISSRSIRYDLEEIEAVLKRNNIIVEKKPRLGIWIEEKEGLDKILGEVTSDTTDDLIYSIDNRWKLIFFNILFQNKAITSEALADKFKISRSTVLTTIKEVNKKLKNENLSIKGKQYYGYTIEGREEDIRTYFKNFVETNIEYIEGKRVLQEVRCLFEKEEQALIEKIVKGINQSFVMEEEEKLHNSLKAVIGLWVKRIKLNQKINYINDEVWHHRKTSTFKRCEDIYYDVISKLNLAYDLNEVVYLNKLILSRLNDDELLSTTYDKKFLIDVVNQMVALGYEVLNIKDEEIETLSQELESHLKMTLNRCKLNIKTENSILEQIKFKYGDVFKVAREAGKIFEESYNVSLSDDEIGFITMYFCKSLESSKIRVKKNVIVVCNSSRGTSKLLAARIKNNIPEINVKKIMSVSELQSKEVTFDDVDLIISTVKLEGIKKAHIVVNPIITSYNLSQIRDFIYINNTVYENQDIKNDFEANLKWTISKHYTNIETNGKLYEEILGLLPYYTEVTKSSLESENKYVEKVALMLAEIYEMISKLFKDEIEEELLRKICGVTLHVFMAIPRWKAGEFNEEKDIDYYKKSYKEKYQVIEETLESISNKNKFPIKSEEIVSIIRYLL